VLRPAAVEGAFHLASSKNGFSRTPLVSMVGHQGLIHQKLRFSVALLVLFACLLVCLIDSGLNIEEHRMKQIVSN
jgi:hypothetical protein